MKRVMIVAIVMVMLLSISEKAQADPWTNWAFGRSSCGRLGRNYNINYNRYGSILTLGQDPWTNWAFGRSSYGRLGGDGGYGYYGRDRSTLGKISRYVRPGMNIVGGLHQMSVDNRLVDHQISMDNQMADIIREEQRLRHGHGQHRIIGARSNTALRKTVPVRIIRTKPKKTQTQKNEKVQQIQQQLEALEIQMQELRQELEQAKK